MTVYLTGDTHGDFLRVSAFCRKNGLADDDVVVILGDAGANYHGPGSTADAEAKAELESLPPTFLCVHGNHEMRPEGIEGYGEVPWRGGVAYAEPEYPSVLFARDGEVYDLEGAKAVAIGGAYSVDKPYRLARGWRWFPDEQPDGETKVRVEEKLEKAGWKVDYVLTHTCPYDWRPTDMFMPGIDQSTVDTSTEEWLQEIEGRLEYRKWYFGHFHWRRERPKWRMLFENWCVLGE